MKQLPAFPLARFAALLVLLCSLPGLSSAEWKRIYGGAGRDLGYSVRQTTDGGYMVAGITTSYSQAGMWDPYLIKTNASGDTLWTRHYVDPQGVQSFSDYMEGQQTADGGYVLASTMYHYPLGYQVWLIKTDPLGNTSWTQKYGGSGNEGGYSVQQTSDGGYIVAGYTDTATPGIRHVFLVKTNSAGDTLWTRTIGGASNDYGYSVRQMPDNGYVVAGLTQSFGNGLQAYLIRTDASGHRVWQRDYGGPAQDQAYSVQPTMDGGCIVAGMSYDPSMSYQAWLIKTDASGDTLWTGRYGQSGTEYAESVQQKSDGGYVVAGLTNSWTSYFQVYLFETDPSGRLQRQSTYDYPGYAYSFGMSVRETTDHGFIVAGYTDNYGAGNQVYLIKTDPDASDVGGPPGGAWQFAGGRLEATPNPFVSFTTVPDHGAEQFVVYDLAGRRIETCFGDRVGARLGAGVYFLMPEGGGAGAVRIVKLP